MKKKSVIAGAVAAGIFLCIIILCICASGNPRNIVRGALANTANDISGIYLVDYVNKLANGGSVTVTGNLEPLSGKNADAELKIYTDLTRMRFAALGKIKEGKTVQAEFTGAFNGNEMSLDFPKVSKKPYGVSFKNLSSNLPKSVFNPETGDEELKLDKNVYEYLTKFYKTVSADKNLANESKKLSRDYELRLVNALLDNARVSTSSDKITAGGQQLNCTVVTLDFDRKSLVNAVSDLVTYAKHDKNLESYLLKVYSNYDYGIKDADDMIDDFYDNLDSFKRAVKNYDGDMTVWIYITKSGKRIAKVDIDTDGKNGSGTRIAYEISLELGKNVKNSEEISLTVDDSNGNSTDIRYSVRQNDRQAYKASVSLTQTRKNGAKVLDRGISFKWDKKAGGYTLSCHDKNRLIDIEGKLSIKGDAYVFTFENIERYRNDRQVEEEDSDRIVTECGLKLTFDKTDRAPNTSRYAELTKMNAEDLKALISDTKKAVSEIKDTWFKKR